MRPFSTRRCVSAPLGVATDELGALRESLFRQRTNRADAVLLGRKTYEIFIQHWPHVGDDDPIGAKLNAVPKYVASRTLGSADWGNTTVLRGELAAEVARSRINTARSRSPAAT
jgi:dihydrofolate reductase